LGIRRDPRTNESRFPGLQEALALAEDDRRGGGSLELVCADFRDFTRPMAFDVVYCPWSWQCLDKDGRRELPRRAFAWLAPGGACRVVTQNLQNEQSRELAKVFTAAGFFRRDELASTYWTNEYNQGRGSWERHQELSAEDDQRARGRLDAGEKMYDVYNASG
jgi:hypothetical protein